MSRITVFLARKEPGNSGVTSSVIPGTDALLPVLVLLQGEAGAASIHGASSAGGFLGDEFRLEHDKAIVEKGAREPHDEDLCSKGPRAWFEQFGDAAFDVVRRDEGALREVCLVALCDVAMTCSESSSRPMAASQRGDSLTRKLSRRTMNNGLVEAAMSQRQPHLGRIHRATRASKMAPRDQKKEMQMPHLPRSLFGRNSVRRV